MNSMSAAAVGLAMAALAVSLTSTAAVGAPSNGSATEGTEWPMFHGGFTHAGASQAVGPSSKSIRWTLKFTSAYVDRGMSPVVGSDGTIYQVQAYTKGYAPDVARLRAISPTTHKNLWTWSGKGRPFFSTPAVAPDGTVYVVIDGQDTTAMALYAVEPGGTTLWEDPASSTFQGDLVGGPPTIGPDGTVYVEDERSVVYALNPQDGAVDWSFAGSQGGVGYGGTPAVSPDGTTLYVTSAGGDLYALSAGPSGGQLEWTDQVEGSHDGFLETPAVGPDGTIYVATGGLYENTPSVIQALNPDGTLEWTYASDSPFETTPTVTAAGQVVAGDEAGTVVALRQSDGSLAWSYPAGIELGSAASDADGDVYLQSSQKVFALSPQGSLLWAAKDSTTWGGDPALDGSGTLYVTGNDARNPSPSLIAFESSASS
jgi:outer membrane protein assembly factor BamB